MKVSGPGPLQNRVQGYRQQRGWSQDELARRAGISRAAVSAIEIQRLVPSVAAALALATALDCRVEDLFGAPAADEAAPTWAWPPSQDPCRLWHARVGDRLVLYPAATTTAGIPPHDGVFQRGCWRASTEAKPENTLVMASCDPAAGFLADALARTSHFRLLVLQRASQAALDLLRRGLVHLAGVHLATDADSQGNARAAKAVLGAGHSLLAVATWQEGLSLGAGVPAESVRAILRSRLRWVGRERGSGARHCQDELLEHRPLPRRLAQDHRGVAEAIRCGWAEVGVCVRLVSEEAGLKFLPVREEAYELCFPSSLENDPRFRALLQVVRSHTYRTFLSELPGYEGRSLGDITRIE